jgi:hypothetical protein
MLQIVILYNSAVTTKKATGRQHLSPIQHPPKQYFNSRHHLSFEKLFLDFVLDSSHVYFNNRTHMQQQPLAFVHLKAALQARGQCASGSSCDRQTRSSSSMASLDPTTSAQTTPNIHIALHATHPALVTTPKYPYRRSLPTANKIFTTTLSSSSYFGAQILGFFLLLHLQQFNCHRRIYRVSIKSFPNYKHLVIGYRRQAT